MNVGIIGLGYVGLSMAVCVADSYIKVYGYDIDEHKMADFRAGNAYIREDGLQKLMIRARDRGFLTGADSIADVVKNSDIIFISVGTPSQKDGSINLNYVLSAAAEIGNAVKDAEGYRVIVIKSTVTPGTAKSVIDIIQSSSKKIYGTDFGVCSNPEFLREGRAVFDFMNPDKIVVGATTDGEFLTMRQFYEELYGENPNIIETTHENAELIKYASNAFLATKISFINELSRICERIPGADINIIRDALYTDPRVGPHFLNAGIGYGGSCLGKDIDALVNIYYEQGIRSRFFEEVGTINGEGAVRPVTAIMNEGRERGLRSVKSQKIGVLGLSFKSGTDDIRDSAAIRLVNILRHLNFTNIVVHDPVAMDNARAELGDYAKFGTDYRDVLEGANWVIIATEWNEYVNIQPGEFVDLMETPNVFDGRRIYNAEVMINGGVNYYGIGYGRY